MISAVSSHGRKFMLTEAIAGPTVTSTATLITIPINEDSTPMPSARPGSPFWAMG